MNSSSPLLTQRLHMQRARIQRMLSHRAGSAGGQGTPAGFSPVLSGFGGTKYADAGQKFRFVNPARLGNLQPASVLRIGRGLPEKFDSIRSMLHLRSASQSSANIWQEVERTLPLSAPASQAESTPEPGVLRQGSIIQKFQTVPRPGQSIESFKEQLQKSPRPPSQQSPPKPAAPRKLDPNYRRFSKVEEVPSARKQEQQPPAEPDQSAPPASQAAPPQTPATPSTGNTVQRQPDVEPTAVRPEAPQTEKAPSPAQAEPAQTVQPPQAKAPEPASAKPVEPPPAPRQEAAPVTEAEKKSEALPSAPERGPEQPSPVARAVPTAVTPPPDGTPVLRALPTRAAKEKEEAKPASALPKAQSRPSPAARPDSAPPVRASAPKEPARSSTVRPSTGTAPSPSAAQVVRHQPDGPQRPAAKQSQSRAPLPLARPAGSPPQVIQRQPDRSAPEREISSQPGLTQAALPEAPVPTPSEGVLPPVAAVTPEQAVEPRPGAAETVRTAGQTPPGSEPLPRAEPAATRQSPLEAHVLHRRQAAEQVRFVDPGQVKQNGFQPAAPLLKPGSIQQKYGGKRPEVEPGRSPAMPVAGRSDQPQPVSEMMQRLYAAPPSQPGMTPVSPFSEMASPAAMEMPVARQFTSAPAAQASRPVQAPPTPAVVAAPLQPTPLEGAPQVEQKLPSVSKPAGGVVQRMWEEHQEMNTNPTRRGVGSSEEQQQEEARNAIDLDKLAEDIFPLVKRLLDIESERYP